jgi:hypothetical protein
LLPASYKIQKDGKTTILNIGSTYNYATHTCSVKENGELYLKKSFNSTNLIVYLNIPNPIECDSTKYYYAYCRWYY